MNRLRPILRAVLAVIVVASLVVAGTTRDSLERTDAVVFGGFCFILLMVLRASKESPSDSDSPPAADV